MLADADGVAALAPEVPDDADVELGVVAVVEVVEVDAAWATVVDEAAETAGGAETDVAAETDVVAGEAEAAVVDWCVPALAMHPVRAAAPATLNRPVAYRARFAGCGRRRRR